MLSPAALARSFLVRGRPHRYGLCLGEKADRILQHSNWPTRNSLKHFSRSSYAKEQLSKGLKQIPRKKFRPSSGDNLPFKGEVAQNAAAGVQADESQLVTAYCVAQGYNMNHVYRSLSARGMHAKLPTNPIYSKEPQVIHLEMPLHRFSGKSMETADSASQSTGDVFIFPSGTVVSWGIPRLDIEHLTTEILRSAAQEPLGTNAEDENLEYVEDPQESKSLVRGETIMLGTKTDDLEADLEEGKHRSARMVLTKIAFSSSLARATKLAVLENLVDEYSQSSRSVLSMLNGGPMARLKSRRWVYRRLGYLLDLRAQLNLYSELADDLPDLFWDTKQELGLESYYDQVGRALDVLQRIKILNQKMDYAEEIIRNLRDMRSEIHSSRLEWIIIWLITFEVLHTIWIEVRRVLQERSMEGSSLDVAGVRA